MLRLFIKIFIIVFIIYFIHINPIPIPCFCDEGSFFTRCIEGSKLTTEQCNEISKIVKVIDDAFNRVARDIVSIATTLSKDIPHIPTNIPKVATMVSDKYTNYTIPDVPKIPDINLSCPINIPLSQITDKTNQSLQSMQDDINRASNQINNSEFAKGIDKIVSVFNDLKTRIDSVNIGAGFKFNIGISCESGYTLNGLVCVPDPPPGYETRPGDIVNYWLTEPTSYLMGTAQQANQDNSACNSLTNVITGIGTCSGWKGDINCVTKGCGCIKQPAVRERSCADLSNVIYGVGTCSGWKGDINCTTRGCGCIKQRVNKDCSSCSGLCNVVEGVNTCTGTKK